MGNLPDATKNLLIINVLMFIVTYVLGLKGIDLNNILGMHYFLSSAFKPYQIITYMFMHGGFTHIFFNMFALFMFGAIVERVWGAKKFLFYYFFAGIGAAITQQVVWYFMADNYVSSVIGNVHSVTESMQYADQILSHFVTIGASGAIFGLLLAFGWMFPNEKLIFIFIPVPIKARYFIVFYAFLELFMGVASFSGDSVAHFAHLGGMLFGLILLLYWKNKGKLFLP